MKEKVGLMVKIKHMCVWISMKEEEERKTQPFNFIFGASMTIQIVSGCFSGTQNMTPEQISMVRKINGGLEPDPPAEGQLDKGRKELNS